MHDTAYEIGGAFIREYSKNHPCIIVEIGSMDFNGTLRDHVEANDIYIGLDVEHGKSVDLVIDPLKPLPLRDNFADIVLSSSQMEHDKFFWKTFLDLARITKENGYIYISAPSNGDYHCYPIDCWRFYPDSGLALAEWATANGIPCTLIESFTAGRRHDNWNDYIAIFQKCSPDKAASTVLISDMIPCYNVRKFGSDDVTNKSERTEDFLLITDARKRLATAENEIRALNDTIVRLQSDVQAATERVTEKETIFGATLADARQDLAAAQEEIRTLNETIVGLRSNVQVATASVPEEKIALTDAQQHSVIPEETIQPTEDTIAKIQSDVHVASEHMPEKEPASETGHADVQRHPAMAEKELQTTDDTIASPQSDSEDATVIEIERDTFPKVKE